MSMLLIALFLVGMTYLDPPQEYGIAVNFGTSSVGKGNVQPKVPIKSVPREVVEQPPQEVQETSTPEETEATSDVSEEVATQELEEAIAIKKEEERKRKADEVAKKEREEKERIEREKQAEIAKQKAEEEAKRKKLDALIGGINNSEGATTGGEGNDNVAGDKGKTSGDLNSEGYLGNGGAGGDGNYQLGNRKALSRPVPDYICDEEGWVIVRIEVDINGRVTKASAGVKGSTNTAECLLSQAQEAAMKTKWQADSNAPSKQVGTIKYWFGLTQ